MLEYEEVHVLIVVGHSYPKIDNAGVPQQADDLALGTNSPKVCDRQDFAVSDFANWSINGH
jgi:hypothetical protein